MAAIDWSIKGPHFVNCNCDYGCPCQFNALPTYRTCLAVVAWQIEEGHFGDVPLDGLRAVNTYAWPGAVHEGDGSMQSIIDARADQRQRAALTAIPGIVFSGSQDGGVRAYSAADGSIVWQFDTNKEFETVNGVTANGGDAVFLVDSTLEAAGEGRCKPSESECAFAYIGPGSEYVFTEEDGDTYTIEIDEIRKVEVGKSANGSAKGAKARASVGPQRRFVPPVLVDLVVVASDRLENSNNDPESR